MFETRIGFQDDLSDATDFLATRGAFMTAASDPCKRLMFEILADALRIYSGDRQVVQAAVDESPLEEIEAWIVEDNDLLFGFASVCSNLGLNVDAMRMALPKWRERRKRSHDETALQRRAPGGLLNKIQSHSRQLSGPARYHQKDSKSTLLIGMVAD